MSAQKDTIRRMFAEIVNLGKTDLVDDVFHPEFRSVTPQGTLDREQFKGFVEGWRNAFPDLVCEVDDLIEEGDRIAWSVRTRGTHAGDLTGIPATGRSVDFVSLNVGTFKDGLAYRHTMVMNEAEMLAQLGLMPPPA